MASLRDLPDLDCLEAAGLLGKAPLPDELRQALGISEEVEEGTETEPEEEFDESFKTEAGRG